MDACHRIKEDRMENYGAYMYPFNLKAALPR